jgi:hypothetical protein
MLGTVSEAQLGVAMPSRLLRLQPYEALIFVVLIVLFALCLAVAPVVTASPLRSAAAPKLSAGPVVHGR